MKATAIDYEETDAFQKDLKRLTKKFRSLTDDLHTVKKHAIELFHINKIDNLSVFPIPGFYSPKLGIYKIKKFACKSLKGRGNRSGIRVIYAFHPKENKVVFLEIYFKANQTNEDRSRIVKYIKSIQQ